MRLCLFLAVTVAIYGADGLVPGKADIQSAGPMAFSPSGILFLGDSEGAQVFALDPGDPQAAVPAPIAIEHVDEKIAALLGTTPDQIRIHDIKVHPVSHHVYFSISRGRGADAIPVLLRFAGNRFEEVALENIPHASVHLPGVPAQPRSRLHADPRRLVITDLGYTEGKLLVAGLSNEEFSSNLRVIPFPFHQANPGASIEIYHTSHFTYETDSPVRTFVPYTLDGQPYILAAYTCTPLVKIPLSELQPGAHVRGATIAELGRHSSPLDMIAYRKDGHDYLLIANTLRGVLQIPADHLDDFETLTPENVTTAEDIPMRKINALKGVVQLEPYGDADALVLTEWHDSMDLRSVPLP